MTKNEAIKICNTMIFAASLSNPQGTPLSMTKEELTEAMGIAIKALEEVQQYRQIGTVEECRKSVEICKSMIGRNITPENMEEYMKFDDECISEGFTFNSLLEAREKQTANKPDYEGDGYSDGQLVYDTWICPSCGKHYEVDYDNYDYCPNCGQHIDWSNEE